MRGLGANARVYAAYHMLVRCDRGNDSITCGLLDTAGDSSELHVAAR